MKLKRKTFDFPIKTLIFSYCFSIFPYKQAAHHKNINIKTPKELRYTILLFIHLSSSFQSQSEAIKLIRNQKPIFPAYFLQSSNQKPIKIQ